MYETNNLECLLQTVQLIINPCCILLIFVALLTLRVRARLGGLLVRFSAGFLGLPTRRSGWYDMSVGGYTDCQRYPKSS